jgi:hypothetical protein
MSYAALDAHVLITCFYQVSKTAARAALEATQSVVHSDGSRKSASAVPLLDHTAVAAAIASAGCRPEVLVATTDSDDAAVVDRVGASSTNRGKTVAFRAGASVVVCCVRENHKVDDVKLSEVVGVRCQLLGARRCEEVLG